MKARCLGRCRKRSWRFSNRLDSSKWTSRISLKSAAESRSAGSACCTRKAEMDRLRVGVIGCGAISGAYLGMAKNFPLVEMAACSDIDLSRAKAAADKYEIPRACVVDELLADASIELILNLTV